MKVFRNLFPALAGALLTAGTAVTAADNATSEHPVQTTTPVENTMKIVIETDQQTLTATLLQDSAAARDFVALLPLQLTLTDYAATEKISDLPGRLSTDGEPSGTAAKAGDISRVLAVSGSVQGRRIVTSNGPGRRISSTPSSRVPSFTSPTEWRKLL